MARVTAETGLREEDLRPEQLLQPGPGGDAARPYLIAARSCLLDGLYYAASVELRDAARAAAEASPVIALLARLNEATPASATGRTPPGPPVPPRPRDAGAGAGHPRGGDDPGWRNPGGGS